MHDPFDDPRFGPWHPGLQSQIPRDLLPLATLFRPDHVRRPLAEIEELADLTGFTREELTVFRPQRLALHELLLRVTADISVPDGTRIEDLGINFRQIVGDCSTGMSRRRCRRSCAAYERRCAALRGHRRARALRALRPQSPRSAPARTGGGAIRHALAVRRPTARRR